MSCNKAEARMIVLCEAISGVRSFDKINQLRGNVHHSDRMSEARAFRPLESEKRNAELMHSAQALKLFGVDQIDDQSLGRVIAVKNDVLMNRVEICALAMCSAHYSAIPARTDDGQTPASKFACQAIPFAGKCLDMITRRRKALAG